MTTLRKFIGGCALAVLSTPAAAHGDAQFLGPIYGAFLHTVVVPAEGLVVIATGLALGTSGRRIAQIGTAAFAAALTIGLLVGGVVYYRLGLEVQLVAIALVGAALVAAALKVSTVGALSLSVLAGFTVGLDAFPDAASVGRLLIAGGATLTGGSLAMILITGLVVDRNEFWQRIAVRVAGSWIAAISMLYLAWSITAGS